jgi:hypothetical protein
MTPLKVSFTGLELDPADLTSRVLYGVIPRQWHRQRFPSEAQIFHINQWLSETIEGRWAILARFNNGLREITIAFELDYDCSLFALSDGARRCAIIEDEVI